MNNNISGRYIIDLINKNQLYMDEELLIYEVLLKKYPLISIPDYAEKIGKTPNGVRFMIKNKRLPTSEVNGKTMIIDLI